MDRVGPREWAALRAVILIGRAEGEIVSADEVASYLQKSRSYTEVLLFNLRDNGFLVSNRGPRGGYILGINPKKMTVGEIMESIRGKRTIEDPLISDLAPVVKALNERLNKITIESLL